MGKISARAASNANDSNVKSNGHDAYCWMCHNLKATVFCATCPRSYHPLCTGSSQNGTNDWRCDYCLKVEKAQSNWAKWKFDSSSLRIALERALDTKNVKTIFAMLSSKEKNKLVNPMDLAKIKEKIEANEYKTPEEFYVDVKWIQHNFSIMHPNKPKYGRIVKAFLAACELELTSLSHCTDCYEQSEKRARHWFTAYCIPPHLVIWAKYMTYPFWPGKLMSADGEKVDVQFFGDHTFETVSANNCLIYSEKHPETIPSDFENHFKIAQEECQRYIKRIRGRFGDFKYGKDGEKLNMKNIKRHVENMFPKLKDDGVSTDIQFKRMIQMEKSSVMEVDDSSLDSSDSNSGAEWVVNSEDLPDSDESEMNIVGKAKNPKKIVAINEPIDRIELEIQEIFGPDEPEKVNDESDPLRIDFQTNDEQSSDTPQASVTENSNCATNEFHSVVKEEANDLRRINLVSVRMRKRMRLESDCDQVNSSERPESSNSCESVFSQTTVYFEFDKENAIDESAAAVEPPVQVVPIHDVVHSTQCTPPPNLPPRKSGLDIPIRAYIEALERLKDELLTQNMYYGEQLVILRDKNKKLREENLRLIQKNGNE